MITKMDITEVKKLFESNLEGRILKSDLRKCNIDILAGKVNEWRKAGDTIVFTAGVFDIFTINHLLGLYHYKSLGGKNSRLVISVDTDERVKNSKSFHKSKGGSAKPILSWDNRVLMIAKQSFKDGDQLADLIVQHGADTCSGIRCPHDDNVDIARCILPDVTVVTDTSTETIESIEQTPDLRRSLVIINENDLSYSDIYIGGKISTTGIIERIKNGV